MLLRTTRPNPASVSITRTPWPFGGQRGNATLLFLQNEGRPPQEVGEISGFNALGLAIDVILD